MTAIDPAEERLPIVNRRYVNGRLVTVTIDPSVIDYLRDGLTGSIDVEAEDTTDDRHS